MTGLIMPWSVGMLSGGGAAAELVVGGQDNSAGDTISWTGIALNDTASAGDVIVVVINAFDGDVAASATLSASGWTIVQTSRTLSSTTRFGSVIWKSASGGETTVDVSGSLSFSGSFNVVAGQVFLLKGVSATALDSDSGVGSVTLDTSGAAFVVGAAENAGSITGGGSVTKIDTTTADAWYDVAPLGGASDTYTASGAMAAAAWG